MSSLIPTVCDKIESNFEVSVLLPFYRKYDEFRRALQTNAPYFQRNGIEVIILMDSPQQEDELVVLLKQYPFINWKVLINRQPHEWRNPVKVLNVGIRHASKKYILAMDPESEMHTDVILQLRYMAELYPHSYFLGSVLFVDSEGTVNESNMGLYHKLPYGSILAAREDILAIRGYDESYTTWGGDDNNIRSRLDLHGCTRMMAPQAILLHREKNNREQHKSRTEKYNRLSMEVRKKAFYPQEAICNDLDWGTDFSECIYDYANNAYGKEMCLAYLSGAASQFALLQEDAFDRKLRCLILIPTYNEKRHIPEVLQHLDKYCDGIILLDDESNDGTYELAASKKLLLKAQKQKTGLFTDLENRNMLLKIASFLQSEWIIFMDADERFDSRWPLQLQDPDLQLFDTICFYLVHLWDDVHKYRADIPESSPIGQQGIVHRWRMFRNKGHMQILSPKTLHFPSIPYRNDKLTLPVLILHLGMLQRSKRLEKYSRYLAADDEREKYHYFLAEDALLHDVAAITELPVYKQLLS
ncbi:MAG: glycosyltransferase [Niastella sp.]|nr:glycosyltransferase [Niastella sp.]